MSTVLVVDIGDGLLEITYFFLEEGLEVGFVLADRDACQLFVLVALFVWHHHAEVFPG